VPTSVKAGDRVLLPGWGGNAIKLGEAARKRYPFLFAFFSFLFEQNLGLRFFIYFFDLGFYRNPSCSIIRRFWPRGVGGRDRQLWVDVDGMSEGYLSFACAC